VLSLLRNDIKLRRAAVAAITIRNLSDATHRALKARAAASHRSTEAEVRAILDAAVSSPDRVKVGSLFSRATFSRRFGALTGRPPLTYLTWWRMTLAA
jgi:plasmid stability protein